MKKIINSYNALLWINGITAVMAFGVGDWYHGIIFALLQAAIWLAKSKITDSMEDDKYDV